MTERTWRTEIYEVFENPAFKTLSTVPLFKRKQRMEGGFSGGVVVKILPANAGDVRVWSLGWEVLLEEGMATYPVFLPGESHGQSKESRCES